MLIAISAASLVLSCCWINVDAQTSAGSCYDSSTHAVSCNVAEAACTGSWYAPGYMSGRSGCCHCKASCPKANQTAACEAKYYDKTEATSKGSCYNARGDHGVDCDVDTGACTGSYYAPGYVSGSSGCCHCKASCPSDKQKAECEAKYYDKAASAASPSPPPASRHQELKTSKGSCYDTMNHQVDCDVSESDCTAVKGSWYAPGYVSGRSGCCHCKASCPKENQKDDCAMTYYDVKMKPDVTKADLTAGGCCYNYYNEHKCPCVKDGGYPIKQCNSASSAWIEEGGHGINCTGRWIVTAGDNFVTDDLAPAPYWTKAKDEYRLETPCKDAPFCLDFATSAGSCYDSSGDPSSGHVVVCNVDEFSCKAGGENRFAWFPPGYASKDRDGKLTCCHCNAGCDHTKENSELDCIHSVGYRDVTTPECNRKDGVADRENAGHTDLADYTIGRKKCAIPKGISHDAGVIRKTSGFATTVKPTVVADDADDAGSPSPGVSDVTDGAPEMSSLIGLVLSCAIFLLC